MVLVPDYSLFSSYYFVIQGYVALYAMLIVIGTYGVYLIVKSRTESLESNKLYQRGLGAFFASVAASQALYLTDVVNRAFTGARLLPSETEYAGMGFVFNSFHPQFYFIIILTAVALSMAFLVYPIEKFMVRRKRMIITILVSIAVPIPLIVRALEHTFLPVEGDLIYYVFTAGFIYCWAVIALSIVQALLLYLKVAKEVSGVIRKRALYVVLGMIVWLVTIFMGSNILKNSESSPEQFWIMPALETILLVFLLKGFRTEEEGSAVVERPSFFTPAMKKIMVVVFIAVVFLTAFFTVYDYPISVWAETLPGADDKGSFYGWVDVWGEYPTWVIIGIGAIMWLVSYRKKEWAKYRPYLWFLFLTAIIAPGIIGRLLKIIIGRPRPSYVHDMSEFLPLFALGSDYSNNSFPSGHTAAAFTLFALVFLIPKEKRALKVLAAIGLATWGIAVAVARVVQGSHWSSDVLFGALITLLTELMLWIWRYRAKVTKVQSTPRQPPVATA